MSANGFRFARWVTTPHGWGIELDGELLGTVSMPGSFEPPGLKYLKLVWKLSALGKFDGVWVPEWPHEYADIRLYKGETISSTVHYDHAAKAWTVGLYTPDRYDTAEQAMEKAMEAASCAMMVCTL